ncbi:MAG: SHOCT domain-containing protein [Clostridia bacterium]|nr:SHOCT domain-containing protein [Clostridia bacterium]
MNALGMLEEMLLAGQITEEEYREKKTVYIETLLELYIKDIITKDELYAKLNQ